MDVKCGLPSDWDGSSLVGEIDDDFAETFCPRHEDSKLDITTFSKETSGREGAETERKTGSSATTGALADLHILAAQPDLCQIFSIYQKNSYSRLSVTHEVFESLLSAYSVFHWIWDFVLPFRFRFRESDIGSAPFKFRQVSNTQTRTSNPGSFECAYSFRYAVRNQREKQLEGNPDYDPWSIRQTAVYQKYDNTNGKMTFILIAPSSLARERLEIAITRGQESGRPLNTFQLHRLLVSTLQENWRLYIRGLEHSLKDQSDRVTLAQIQSAAEPLSPLSDLIINFLDRQRIKRLQEKILDLKVIFDSLLDTLSRIQRQCQRQCRGPICEDCTCSDIFEELDEQINDIRLNAKRTDVLHERVLGTAQILSDLLEYENAKSLNGLMNETREENGKMRILTERSTRDAAAVKILTIITLIYLPITVVANFFSTQLIHVDDNGTLSVAKDSWWFAVVSIPLTFATFLAWRFWMLSAMQRRDHWPEAPPIFEKLAISNSRWSFVKKVDIWKWFGKQFPVTWHRRRSGFADDVP